MHVAYTCVYACWHVWPCVWGGEAVDLECPSQLLSTSFAETGSLAESRILSAGQLASGIACVCLPNAGIVCRELCPLSFYMRAGDPDSSHTGMRHVVSTEPPPQ